MAKPKSQPHLLLRVIYPDGKAFQMPAGGPLEMNLEESLAQALVKKKVGFFRTSKQVESAFHEAFKEVMFQFKDKVANP